MKRSNWNRNAFNNEESKAAFRHAVKQSAGVAFALWVLGAIGCAAYGISWAWKATGH